MPATRVRRYRHSIRDMIHELKLMRDRGEIKVPSNMSESEFEEIMKHIDKHFSDDGVDIHHPLIRGRITDTSSIEHLTKFFQHIYATSNSHTNIMDRVRNTQNRRYRVESTIDRRKKETEMHREKSRAVTEQQGQKNG